MRNGMVTFVFEGRAVRVVGTPEAWDDWDDWDDWGGSDDAPEPTPEAES